MNEGVNQCSSTSPDKNKTRQNKKIKTTKKSYQRLTALEARICFSSPVELKKLWLYLHLESRYIRFSIFNIDTTNLLTSH